MTTETLEQWNKLSRDAQVSRDAQLSRGAEFSRGALDSLKELSGINIKLVERLVEQQYDLVSASIDASVKGANLAFTTPGTKELASQQAALVSEYNERVLGIARKATGIVAKVRDEYSGWVEGRLKEVDTPTNWAPPAPAARKTAKRTAKRTAKKSA